jgi:hypothetical protein
VKLNETNFRNDLRLHEKRFGKKDLGVRAKE